MNQYRLALVVLSVAAFVSPEAKAAPVIGVASTRGAMEVDRVTVRGTGNVRDGSSVRTADTAGQVRLKNGIRATLERNASAMIYSDHMELLEGIGEVATTSAFDVEALGVRVTAAKDKAVARIVYEPTGRIVVTALEGSVDVHKGGLLLSQLESGKTFSFQPDSGLAGSDIPQSAARIARKPAAHLGGASKAGVSTGVKIGVASGVAAAGTGVGLGVALTGDSVSR